MKKQFILNDNEKLLFRNTVSSAKPIYQDTVKKNKTQQNMDSFSFRRILHEQINASFYFSDNYQPSINPKGHIRYIRSDLSAYKIKKLQRGEYIPELFLDLHGLTQIKAKQEIGALIAACQREYVNCACVMHGNGKDILKNKAPLWLSQHPNILGIHQAPKHLGGKAAIIILIELN